MKIAICLCLSVLLVACQPTSFEQYFANGKTSMSQGNYPEAVIQLKNAVRLSPEHGEARFLLGQTYLKLKKLDVAEKEFERALELNYSKTLIIPLLSEIYYQLGNETSLLAINSKEVGLESKALAKLTFLQAQSYLRNGQHEKVRELVEQIKKLKGSEEYGQLALTLGLLADNQLKAALIQVQHLLKQYPMQKDTLKLAAQLHLGNREPIQAIRMYEQYIKQYPDEHEQQLILARLYSDLNMPLKAEPLVDDLLQLYSQVPLLLQLKALARFNEKDYQVAYDYAEKALQINAEDNSVRFIAGIIAYHNQDMETAHRHLSLMASQFPANHPGLRYLAETQLQLDMTIEASETAARFEALSEQDVTLLSKVGRELVAQGEFNRAVQIKNQPDIGLLSAKTLTNVGLLKLSLNDVTGVLDLETAVKQLKTDGQQQTAAELEATLAQAYLSTGKADQAIDIGNKWLTQAESELKGHLLLAKVYRKQHKTSLAKQAYLQALVIEPNQPAVKFALIEISPINTIKQAKKALFDASKIIEQHPDFVSAIVFHYMMSKRLGIDDEMIAYVQSRLIQLSNEQSDISQIEDGNKEKEMKITLAKMLLLEQEFERAVTLLEQVKTDTPEKFWSHLANTYIQMEQYKKAEGIYQEWHLKQPNNPEAIVGQIKVLRAKQDFEQGLKLSKRYLVELGGKHLEVQILHAQLLVLNQRFLEASTFLNKLPTQLQKTPFLKGVLGQNQLHQNQFEAALPNLEAAYQVNPSPQNARLIALTKIRLSGYQQAVDFLISHLDTQDKDVINILFVADLLIDIDSNKAMVYYRRLLNIQPDNIMAINNLAYLLAESGVYEEAYELVLNAIKIQPDSIDVLDTAGAIALKLDKNKEALNHLSKGYNLSGKEPSDELVVNYIEALFKNNQIRLAERNIDRHQVSEPKESERLEQLIKRYL